MTAMNQSQFAEHSKVTRAAVSKAVKEGRIAVRSDKLIDPTDPKNLAYVQEQAARKGGGKPPPKRPPRRPPRVDFVDVPGGELPPDSGDEEDEEDDGDSGDLIGAEKRASIKLKNAQTARHIQALAERMGLLVLREVVEQHDSKVAVEINRFITSCRTINKRYRAMVQSGSSEKETQTYLEDEMTAITKSVKLALEDF